MKTLTLIFLSLFISSVTIGDNREAKTNENAINSASEYSNLSAKEVEETTVLICTGIYSKRYHNSMCKGMKACKGERKKVSLSEAKKMGLTACGYCYE